MANLMTPVFRASFAHLNKPRAAAQDAAPKYSVMVVLDQDNKAHVDFLAKLQAECDRVAREKFGNKLPKKLRLPFRDGDDEDRPEWAGAVVFNASASEDYKPEVVDTDRNPILDPAEVYSGMWCRVTLRPYAWDHPTGGKGVSIGLGNVQKIRDDEPFSGGVKAEDEFSVWSED